MPRVLAAMIAVALLSVATSGAPVPAQSLVTVADPDGVNLRGGPGTEFVSLAVIPQGTALPVLGEKMNGRWIPTSFEGKLGFVLDEFVQPRTGAAPGLAVTPTTPAAAPPTVMRVTSPDGVNLRTGPATSERAILVIPRDSRLTVEGRSTDGTWLQVRYAGQSGWVHGQFLAPADAPAPASTNASPYIWPVTGRSITSYFGPGQLGIDIDQYPSGGNSVVAAAGGTVTFAGGDPCCSYGLHVIVEHADGVETLYAHLQSIEVTVGQAVAQEQALGRSGNTGRSTGAHLHFEVRVNGTPVDPHSYLRR